MQAGIYTPRFGLSLYASPTTLQRNYQARLADPSQISQFSQDEWKAHNDSGYYRYLVKKDFYPNEDVGKRFWVRSGPERLDWALRDTQQALEDPAVKLIDGASFLYNVAEKDSEAYGVYTKPFLLQRLADGAFELIEVARSNQYYDQDGLSESLLKLIEEGKFSQSPLAKDLKLLSIQHYILGLAGVQTDKVTLYVQSGRRNRKPNFFALDVTKEVELLVEKNAKTFVDSMIEYLRENPPQYRNANDLPGFQSVAKLAQSLSGDKKSNKWRTIERLADLGIYDLSFVPKNFPHLDKRQIWQILASRFKQPVSLYRREIEKVFAGRQAPVHYLDFETRPIQTESGEILQIPVQFSNHIAEIKDGQIVILEHDEFYYTDSEDPRLAFARALVESLSKSSGKIVVYNDRFEKKVIAETVRFLQENGHDQLAGELNAVLERIEDQMDYFHNNVFLPDLSRRSLKATYDHVNAYPRLHYSDLPIHHGGEAGALNFALAHGSLSAHEVRLIELGGKLYCGLDTLSMIYNDQFLLNALKGNQYFPDESAILSPWKNLWNRWSQKSGFVYRLRNQFQKAWWKIRFKPLRRLVQEWDDQKPKGVW